MKFFFFVYCFCTNSRAIHKEARKKALPCKIQIKRKFVVRNWFDKKCEIVLKIVWNLSNVNYELNNSVPMCGYYRFDNTGIGQLKGYYFVSPFSRFCLVSPPKKKQLFRTKFTERGDPTTF